MTWIVSDRAYLEEEVREWRKLCYVAKHASKKWPVDRAELEAVAENKKELEILLEHSEGYSHLLQGDQEMRKGEVLKLCEAAGLTQEAKVRDDFALTLLQSERDLTRLQLSEVQKNFEAEKGRLNSELLAHDRELNSTYEELARS